MAKNQKQPQIETTLAYMAVGVIGVSIVFMLLTLGLSALGFNSFPVFFRPIATHRIARRFSDNHQHADCVNHSTYERK